MMRDQFTDNGGATVRVQAQSGAVRLRAEADDSYDAVCASYAPAQARELAGALLRAADEAEGREPVGAERDLLEFIDRAGWDGTAMVSAVIAETRDKVAAELETLPTYNDVADWCAHIGRRQAIETARNGR
jgi:hypothetical protein